MNERLMKEVGRFICEHYPNDERPAVCDVAEHFYNLALEDVNKEARRLSMADPYHPASHRKLDILIEFIDTLKQ